MTSARSRVIFLIFFIVLSAIYVGGCRRAGNWLVKEDVPTHADAIVLLMGSFPERVMEAAELYNEGKADGMLIVYESMGPYRLLDSRGAKVIRTTQQAHDAAVVLGVPADSIEMLPGDARSTIDEAQAVRDYIGDKPGIDTLLLVSSPYHMRRSSTIFNAALRDLTFPVYVGCSPSSYSGFNPDKWWRRREDIQSVLSEYMKITSFVLFERRGISKRTNE